jgi:hypothetical protein
MCSLEDFWLVSRRPSIEPDRRTPGEKHRGERGRSSDQVTAAPELMPLVSTPRPGQAPKSSTGGIRLRVSSDHASLTVNTTLRASRTCLAR